MIGTLTAVLLGGAIWFWSMTLSPMLVLVLGIVVGTLLLVSLAPVNILAWNPLQAAEERITSRVVELFGKDIQVHAANSLLLIWGLFSWVMPFWVDQENSSRGQWVFIAWLIGTGVVLDMHIHVCRRVLKYLSPFNVVQMMAEEGNKEIRSKHDAELCDWIESLTEIANKALKNGSGGLANASVDSLQKLIQSFLQFNRPQLRGADIHSDSHQRASYILYYAFERLDNLFQNALEARNEPTMNHLISALGKVTLSCASADLSLVPYPVHFIGTFAKKAAQKGLEAVSTKANLVLLQVCRLMLTERDVSREDIKKPFLAVTRQLEDVAKETFRQDKTTRISGLTQPFQELKSLLQSERFVSHPDVEVIVSDIDRVLSDFANLELVMRALPPIPEGVKGAETDLGKTQRSQSGG